MPSYGVAPVPLFTQSDLDKGDLARLAARPIRVGLVDDTPEIRDLLRRGLALVGGVDVVGEAGDGAQGIAQVSEHRPDAVLLDLAMPVMDGLQAIPEIRRYSPDTKIVVLSGFKAEDMERQAMAAGADSYLEKGSAFKELASVLRMLCANGASA